jgi:5-methylcytosine-specific restriction endonuclease McrA
MSREYNGGRWTKARFNSFVKSALRSASRRWPVKNECLNKAFTERKINTSTGRMAKHFKCAACMEEFPSSKVQVDHICPIVDPATGFITWDEVIDNMFCEADNLQVLCLGCHKDKTQLEKQITKERNDHSNK